MGSGSFSLNDYQTYASTTKLDARGFTKSVGEMFTQRCINDSLDPSRIQLRESCDGADNPQSNAIIIGLDVTGSMGEIARNMAATGLGKLMGGILETSPVENPHLMFMGIGDVKCDRAPLQVSQFEADIRIAKQLDNLYVEQGGGGNQTESYDLPWYFAATRTNIDCFDKRGKKGYLFTIGDEMTPHGLTGRDINRVFGGAIVYQSYTPVELLTMAEEKYHVFHVVVEEGDYARRRLDAVRADWKKLMGDHAILLNKSEYLSEVITAVIRVNEGEDVEDVISSYSTESQASVRHALFGGSQ